MTLKPTPRSLGARAAKKVSGPMLGSNVRLHSADPAKLQACRLSRAYGQHHGGQRHA
jgi:hypothetical protein